jgi:antitoxin ParD1/3/4
MATMNISLPDQMKEWVERRAASGRYSNSSDVLRDLIREAQDREDAAIARLQREIDKGRQSARTPLTLDEVFSQARARAIAAVKPRDDAA